MSRGWPKRDQTHVINKILWWEAVTQYVQKYHFKSYAVNIKLRYPAIKFKISLIVFLIKFCLEEHTTRSLFSYSKSGKNAHIILWISITEMKIKLVIYVINYQIFQLLRGPCQFDDFVNLRFTCVRNKRIKF